jgi:hypothetical protein
VLIKNSRGVEALATLAVLYVHFQAMLPYCYEQLRMQQAELEDEGEEQWLERNLREPRPDSGRVPSPKLPALAEASAASET